MLDLCSALEHAEGLLSRNDTLRFMRHNVESHRLAQWSALSDCDNITFLDGKGRRTVSGNVLVAFLETTVLFDVMQVVSSDHNRALHLCRDDEAFQDSSSNRDVACERALSVHIVSFNRGNWGLDAKSNVFDKAHGLLALRSNGAFASNKDSILLLVRLFGLVALDVFFGDARHGVVVISLTGCSQMTGAVETS